MSSETFDFIIVGAGSAGCVLADRLTACGRYNVLIIESGGSDRRFWIKVPLGYAKTFKDPKVNWRYTAAPDAGLNGRTAYWPRGRVLGGSSSINAMAYLRGLPHDFNDWEKAGAKGWNWNTARQTYETFETQYELTPNGEHRPKGDGPILVSELSNEMHPFTKHFMVAAKQMGWTVSDNLNGKDTEGIMHMRSTVHNGRRWSSADAFLRPALKRPNLKLISNAHVEKVLLKQKSAIGVQYRVANQQFVARTTGEVILSAGAINSPQVLQMSGIGPAAVLKRNGIKVLHELAQVGQGLQDHLGISYFFHATVPTLNNTLGNWFGRMSSGARYLLTRRGPLSVPVNQVSGFVRSDSHAEMANMQIYCNPMSYITDSSGNSGIDPKAGFLLCAQPCRPTSRGEVNIVSSDPTVAPEIQPNSLSTNHDCDMAIKAGRVLERLAQSDAISAVTKARLAPDVVGMSDDAILDDFRERSGTIFHPTSTCRMGETMIDSVLDARLRVHGMTGLRVVDASAFPNVTSGNTNGPVMMLAARGAELILEDTKAAYQQGNTR
jgi:choline dehydrogenase